MGRRHITEKLMEHPKLKREAHRRMEYGGDVARCAGCEAESAVSSMLLLMFLDGSCLPFCTFGCITKWSEKPPF